MSVMFYLAKRALSAWLVVFLFCLSEPSMYVFEPCVLRTRVIPVMAALPRFLLPSRASL